MTNHPLSVVPKPESELAKVYLYHDRTKHRLDRYARSLGYLDWANQPNPFRRFDGARLIPLPVPKIEAPFNSLLTRLPIEVSGVEAPQQCEDFFKSMKAGGLGGHGGSSCSTIR